MTEREIDQKKERPNEKTYPVPFSLEEIKENITFSTHSSSKHSKGQILNQAFKYHSKGNISEAAKLYQYLINQGFTDYRVFSNYGVILKGFGKLKDAEIAYRKAIHLKPNLAEIHYNLGIILSDLGKLKEAELSFRKAIELNPDYTEAHSGLGTILLDIGKLIDAELSTRKAIDLNPDYAEAHNNLGIILRDLGKLKHAELSTRRAIDLNPDFAKAHNNLGNILLKSKKFKEGWIEYEWRFKVKNREKHETSKPEWSPGKNGRVLLWAEQGPGDQLLYLTLIPDFIGKVNKLIIKVDKRLIPLLQRSFNNKNIILIAKEEYINEIQYDFHLALGSLPKFLRPKLESFKKSKNLHLLVNKEKSHKLITNIMSNKYKKIVGISWKSTSKINKNRSLSLQEFILGIYSPEICFVCLQYGEVKEEIKNIKNNFGIKIYEFEEVEKFKNIDDLAALASICNEIVSIENMTLFIAGGLGIKSYILLTQKCLWYNGHKELKSDWYPSLNFIRQGSETNWSKALNEIKNQIKI